VVSRTEHFEFSLDVRINAGLCSQCGRVFVALQVRARRDPWLHVLQGVLLVQMPLIRTRVGLCIHDTGRIREGATHLVRYAMTAVFRATKGVPVRQRLFGPCVSYLYVQRSLASHIRVGVLLVRWPEPGVQRTAVGVGVKPCATPRQARCLSAMSRLLVGHSRHCMAPGYSNGFHLES
jgi:hypothetical protein